MQNPRWFFLFTNIYALYNFKSRIQICSESNSSKNIVKFLRLRKC